MRGRRRIGKSRLIKEFAEQLPRSFLFTGLTSTSQITRLEQRKEFIKQMKLQGLPTAGEDDWSDIFWVLGNACRKGSVLIALDEISWMGSKDPTFLGKLKIAWDQYFEKNPKLILIIASSVSSWLDKNILKSTGFFGRIDLTLTLRELPLADCIKFWGARKKSISAYEKLKVLAVTGGVPRYLKEIDPKKTAEDNLKKLCFSEEGVLFNEFEQIFHDLFSRRNDIYKEIVALLANTHSLSQKQICTSLGRGPNRVISEYLNDLVTAGFLTSDHSWDLKTKEISKLRRYRLSDNYIRFYLKYILPNKSNIRKGRFKKTSLFDTTKWESIMGLQFENLVIHNSNTLLDALGINWSGCLCDGPYFQTKTQRRKGCQIDYLIQCKNALYACEIKFSKNPIGTKVIDEVKEKIARLSIPRFVSIRPILIHAGDVRPIVQESDYFDQIIDWTELMG